MLIKRSEMIGTRVVEIDRLLERGARGPNGRPCHFIVDPDEVQQVLHSPKIGRQRLARQFFGNGLIFSEGDHWRERRRVQQPSFPGRDPDHHLADVRDLVPGLVSRSDASAAIGGSIDITWEATRFGIEVLYRTAFGQELPEEGDRVQLLMDCFDAVGGVLASTIFPGLGIDAENLASIRTAQAALNEELDRIIEHRRDLGFEVSPKDPLGRLIEALGDDHEGIRDETRTLLLAGAESTSDTIGFLILLLADHLEVQDRLHAAIEAADDGWPPFLDAVVMETLRLFPVVWFVVREVRAALRIGDSMLEPDDLLFVAIAATHRLPELWPDPDRFDPDRFLADDGTIRRPAHRYAYLPFGGGSHLCIGRHLGLHEVREAARALVGAFRFTPDGGERGAELGLVLKPSRETRVRVTRHGSEPR